MGEQYVFNTKEQAQAAISEINADPIFPITGRNARTGKLAPDKQKTERWADEPKERKDGKFYFPRLPKLYRDQQSEEKTNAFKSRHHFSIESFTKEEYQKDWLPEQTPDIEERV